jgi:hypothetical protein
MERATFGPEFTFTNRRLLNEEDGKNSPEKEKIFSKARELYEQMCKVRKDCKITIGYDKHGGNFRVTYNDGWYFEVGIDQGVIEAQTVKGTYRDFLKNRVRLKDDLFYFMKSLGLFPDAEVGGGHIHIGADLFHEDPVLFRNFFADYANHPQLTVGVFSNDNPNHPPIIFLKPEQQEGFVKALKTFDAEENPTLKNFIWNIHSLVYTEAYTPEWGGGAYYQAIRLERMFWINGMNTFELRGFRPQKSVDEFLLQLELIGARMDYLKKNGQRVSFRFNESDADLRPQAIVDNFYSYVTETGLSWNKFKVLLPNRLKTRKPSKTRFGFISNIFK